MRMWSFGSEDSELGLCCDGTGYLRYSYTIGAVVGFINQKSI